jgi:hypothetical protein
MAYARVGADRRALRGFLEIERRRHSLARWLRETAEAALTHEHAYVVGAMSLTQTALAEAFAAELPPAEALAASRAWNKLLLVHLAALLLGYLPPRPS